MPNLLKTRSQQIQHINSTENEEKKQNNQQVQLGIGRKITLKKKNKKSLNDIHDHIIETQTQHLIDDESKNDLELKQKSMDREANQKQTPFISFMGSLNDSFEDLQTPYLHPQQTQSYNLWSAKKNVQALPMPKFDDKKQKIISRTMSKPIEKMIPAQSPLNKNKGTLIRKASFKSQLQTNQKRLSQNPAEVSREKEDHPSIYERSREESRPNLVLKSNNDETTSVLQDEFSLNIESGRLKQSKKSQSTNFLLRQDQFRDDNDEAQNMNVKTRVAKKNISTAINPLQSQLKSAIQSKEDESQSYDHEQQQSISRIDVPSEPYLSKNSRYASYIELQSRQLQEQQKRMNFYADETNKLLCNVENYESSIKDESIIDKQYHPLKYMMEELVELFCLREVIKYQLRYRSYEMITKIYAQASTYYQEKILVEDPIKAYTFSLALKALLPNYEKSELDVIISKIFYSHHLMSFEDFSQRLQPILNSKLVSLLQPDSMKKELDKTIEKTKRLFVLMIEIEYFTKKIKEVLRTSRTVYDSIILECTSFDNPSAFDMQLLQKYFLEGEKKNSLKKLKLGVFFRNTIGNNLLKSNWSDWIYKQEIRLYNRYEGKFVFERLHSENPADRKQALIKANLNLRKNEGENTSIMCTQRNGDPSRKEI